MSANEDIVTLQRRDATSDEVSQVEIHLHGATVTSWKHAGKEVIFVSSKAIFDNKKAIRGGIPFVFPNFGPWDLGPQHGFARTSRWRQGKAVNQTADGDVSVTLTLSDTPDTRAMWDHQFQIDYVITLKKSSLETSFTVKNTGSSEFSFTCLLHTYIRLDDVTRTTITGLKGLTYTDKVEDGKTRTEEQDAVSISKNVDRIYMNTPDTHKVQPATHAHTAVVVTKHNMHDTVVWNPWVEKSKAMADLGDEDYRNFVCVEAGAVSKPVVLAAGQTYTAGQTLTATRDN